MVVTMVIPQLYTTPPPTDPVKDDVIPDDHDNADNDHDNGGQWW